jgi:hypothetical protein
MCTQVQQSAQGERQRRDGVGTSANLWCADSYGNLVHQGQCNVCREYVLHIYGHALDNNLEFLNVRDH